MTEGLPAKPQRIPRVRWRGKQKKANQPPQEPKRTLRDLSRDLPTKEEYAKLAAETSDTSTSDRSVAILLAAQIERYLEFAIMSKLGHVDSETHDKLIERDGALSTFFGKQYLGHALQLYNKAMLADMDIIRRIRNAFAHSVKPIDFQVPEIGAECMKLSQVESSPDMPENNLLLFAELVSRSYHRNRFAKTCNSISLFLIDLTVKNYKELNPLTSGP
jgi:hypothetical protein